MITSHNHQIQVFQFPQFILQQLQYAAAAAFFVGLKNYVFFLRFTTFPLEKFDIPSQFNFAHHLVDFWSFNVNSFSLIFTTLLLLIVGKPHYGGSSNIVFNVFVICLVLATVCRFIHNFNINIVGIIAKFVQAFVFSNSLNLFCSNKSAAASAFFVGFRKVVFNVLHFFRRFATLLLEDCATNLRDLLNFRLLITTLSSGSSNIVSNERVIFVFATVCWFIPFALSLDD